MDTTKTIPVTQKSEAMQNQNGDPWGTLNLQTIWNVRQNHPELIVSDCKKAFNLDETQCDELRFILMKRGVNKWLYARRQFIQLEHELKLLVTLANYSMLLKKNPVYYARFLRKELLRLYARMQEICKMPRWVEWPTHIHKKMKKNIQHTVIKGKRC